MTGGAEGSAFRGSVRGMGERMRRMSFAVLAIVAALIIGLFTASVAGAQTPAATIDAVDSPGPAFQPPTRAATKCEGSRLANSDCQSA